MPKPKRCVDCYWYEPSEDARQGMCLFNPPVPVPVPAQQVSPIARTGGPPQTVIQTLGAVPPTPAHHRCHNWQTSGEMMN